MPTPDELRAAIAAGREDLQAALREASERWDAPVTEADGEDQWTARQAAEHAIGAEAYFTTQICIACGYPGLDLVRPSFAFAGDALQGLDEIAAKSDGKLKYVTERDLAMTHEQWGDVASLMALAANHLHEHAAQIRTATG